MLFLLKQKSSLLCGFLVAVATRVPSRMTFTSAWPNKVPTACTNKTGLLPVLSVTVIGAIDCTHVAIIAPPDDDHHMERNFVNRKNFHSINVQIVSDNNLKILNINAMFPGSTHDAFIWRASNLKTLLSQITFKDCWLLGDSGYPLQVNMLTPFDAPSTSAQRRYNNAHTRGRCVIEHLNGVLKSRFRCLRKHRTLSYMPRSAARIINACAVLHNMCIEEDLFFEDDLDDEDDLAFDTGLSTTTSHTSATLRDRIAANFA
ncbi:hypothetical protein JTE90_002896 [Oedothorax gibbosus]|uniref:DDE Tnp4 domain-containing protein n=1 Tax=Oedothorax gibbosus TaxID=931172 RepID=A0AAV6TRG3_9ARAC|nr:hypothetical protein JTE90_002896 [Oedothorax gibbosus]